ncbi:MAG: damage-control phosphatase ARMT1 family protein [Oliverpabstia sp.]
MRLYASCICCLLNKQEQKLRNCRDEKKKTEYMKELLRLAGNSGDEASAPWLAAQIMKVHEKYFGKSGSYADVKKEFNQLVMSMEEELKQRVLSQPDPLKTALLYARVGNYIDFSALEQVEKEEFLSLFEREKDVLDEKEYMSFCGEMQKAENVVYLLDNCGEIVLDKLVILILKKRFPQAHITAIVRGSEVINDATMEDAVMTGLTNVTEVIGNGDDVAGTILSRVSAEARAKIEKADVIIAKGQGNFESLYGCGKNVYYLFLCKCEWFMRKFHTDRFQGMFLNEYRINFD